MNKVFLVSTNSDIEIHILSFSKLNQKMENKS